MKILSLTITSLILLSVSGDVFSQKKKSSKMEDGDLKRHANELAHKFIITDGHVDLPERLKGIKFTADSINTVVSTKKGDFDFERARKGGLSAPFMSIYIPSSYT